MAQRRRNPRTPEQPFGAPKSKGKARGGTGRLAAEYAKDPDTREPSFEEIPDCVYRVPNLYEPGKMTWKITDNGRSVVRRMAAKGHNKQYIASCMGIPYKVLLEMIKEDEVLREGFNVGLSVLEDRLTNNLLRMSDNGNVIATIFTLKAKFGWRDDGGNVESKPNVTIIMPGAMSDEDWKKMREAGVSPLQLPSPKPQDTYLDELDKRPVLDTTSTPVAEPELEAVRIMKGES